LRTLDVEAGGSRASTIPLSRNHAGYPEGIAGADLVERMRRQAKMYGTSYGPRQSLRSDEAMMVSVMADQLCTARAVLPATGVTNHRPSMDNALHAAPLEAGRLRYCPIGEGYEVTNTSVGIVSIDTRGMKEALFLRSYTADAPLIAPEGAHDLSNEDRSTLTEAGIRLVVADDLRFMLDDRTIRVSTNEGLLVFDSNFSL
jgi:thioredoxin reductase (NADPH)